MPLRISALAGRWGASSAECPLQPLRALALFGAVDTARSAIQDGLPSTLHAQRAPR